MVDDGLIEGLSQTFLTVGVHSTGKTSTHEVSVVDLLGISLTQLSISSISLHEGINLLLTCEIGTHLLIDRSQTGDVVCRGFVLSSEIEVIVLRTISKVVHSDVGIRQVFVSHAELLLVVLIGISSLEEHFDGAIVLLGILQSGAIVGVVETRDLGAVGTVEQSVGIL